MKKIFYTTWTLVTILACNDSASTNNSTGTPVSAPPTIPFSIMKEYPHDTSWFTEGLEFHGGQLYESSGGDNDASPYPSGLGILNMQTGKVDMKVQLDKSKYFGEGITIFNNKLYQLTWKGQTGFIFDPTTFKKIGEFKLPSKEGWGLTHDSTHLIMGDGSNTLYVLSPDSLKLIKTISVTDNNGPVPNINELEYVNGYIYANQWQTSYILKIDFATGKVTGRLDLDSLVNVNMNENPEGNVLNGIAYNSATGTFYITGKMWPKLYEIKLQ